MLTSAIRARYDAWARIVVNDDELIELKSMSDEAITDAFYMDLEFGTAGMRGVLGQGPNRMNAYVVRRATAGLANFINEKGDPRRGVVVAYDSRHKSAEFAKQAALTLAARGVIAHLFPSLRPVPMLSFAVRHINAQAGIVITASHNPSEYNGYKCYWEDGGQMPPAPVSAVVAYMNKLNYGEATAIPEGEARVKGLLVDVPPSVDETYYAKVRGLAIDEDLLKKHAAQLKIIYTPLFGSGRDPVLSVLKRAGFLGISVVTEQEFPNGDFPGLTAPNPERVDAYKIAKTYQAREGADMILGTDPDCDRVGVAALSKDGVLNALNGNQIGCILLDYILSHKQPSAVPAFAVKSIVSTEMARAICDKFGVEMVDVLTGFKYIAEAIEDAGDKKQFVFGFEESCGYLSSTFVRDKDAVNASLLLCECAAYYKSMGMTIYEALLSLFEQYGHFGERVISVKLSGADGRDKIQAIMAALRKQPPTAFGDVRVIATRDYDTGTRTEGSVTTALPQPQADVLYFELEDNAWICVRPSGTEPLIKLYVNAYTAPCGCAADMMQDTARKLDALCAAGQTMVNG